MAARFHPGKQPECPVHCTGTRQLSSLISSIIIYTQKYGGREGVSTKRPTQGKKTNKIAPVGAALIFAEIEIHAP